MDRATARMHLPDLDDEQCRRIATIASSYARLTGRPLVEAAAAPTIAGGGMAGDIATQSASKRTRETEAPTAARPHHMIAGTPAAAAMPTEAGARQSDRDIAAALWNAPIAIVAHGTEADPVFFFGNRVALELFEMDFAGFTRLPSRFSAEPLLREERARLLDRVTRDGIILDYAGVRISSTGRRFRIENAAVWNLTDDTGTPAGQAAAFAEWREVR